MRVTLDPGEMVVAQMLASLRRAVNEAAGTKDRLRDTTTDKHTVELIGAVGEIAFCKAFGAYPDLSVTPRQGGGDVIIKDRQGRERLWDVKATARPDGNLICTPDKAEQGRRTEFYALAIVAETAVDLVGWAPAADLFAPETRTDLGYGTTHLLPRNRLRPFTRKDTD